MQALTFILHFFCTRHELFYLIFLAALDSHVHFPLQRFSLPRRRKFENIVGIAVHAG